MPDKPHTVFVSHAHADNVLAGRFVDALRKRELSVWYDRNNLQVGDSLTKVIETQLKQRTALVVLYTHASLNSPWVRREVAAFQRLADRDHTRLLAAVRATECEMPLLMSDYLHVDAVALGFDAAIDALTKALRAPGKPATSAKMPSVAERDNSSIQNTTSPHSVRTAPSTIEAAALAGKGATLLDLARYDEALDAFDRAVTLDPTEAMAWFAKGATLVRLERGEEALDAYDHALALCPKDERIWVAKGATLYDLARYDEALVAYDCALALNGNSAESWVGKAIVLRALGRISDALDAFERVRALENK